MPAPGGVVLGSILERALMATIEAKILALPPNERHFIRKAFALGASPELLRRMQSEGKIILYHADDPSERDTPHIIVAGRQRHLFYVESTHHKPLKRRITKPTKRSGLFGKKSAAKSLKVCVTRAQLKRLGVL